VTHRRSQNGKLKRIIRSYVYKTSFEDQLLSETICRTDTSEILQYLEKNYPQQYAGLQVSEILDVEHGLVLVDNRGHGIFQLLEVTNP